MNIILKGTAGLLGSKKGALSMFILIAIIALSATGHLDSIAFAAVCASIQGIFCFTQSKTDQMMIGQPPNV